MKLEAMGSEIQEENNRYSDYIGWDKLTEDGNWGFLSKDNTVMKSLPKKASHYG
ncbi:hypothetical protein [Paenibacillus sp. ISL-20]|uniref:hypothetical protein n=1 Tax=Paenibacillus sp. ISL-20 TaxID=2819163 RepID=UPI001BEA7B22|nr:hypothetical protein [Paenibacillus sp. ISL-20]